MNKIKLSELTLREKIGQTAVMQMSWFMNRTDLEEYLKDHPIGNVWLNGNWCMNTANLTGVAGGTLRDTEYYRKWSLSLRNYLKVPPIIGLDPVRSGFATNAVEMANAASVGATNSEELAYEFGKLQAISAKAVGANHCWATVVDIHSRFCAVGLNRTMSDKPETLKKLAKAMINGMQSQGVLGTAKHFPGADPYEYRDAHFVPVCITNISLEEWRNSQGAIFKEMVDAGVDSVMIAHTGFPEVDNRKCGASYRPATISYNILTKLLKEELGFKGVAITDSIDMGALCTAFPDVGDLYVELLNAGSDLLLNVKSYDYIDIVEKAVKDGRISESRIDDACSRVLAMKEKRGLFNEPEEVIYDEILEKISEFNKAIAENAITLECDIEKRLPIDKTKIKNVAIICSAHADVAFESLETMKKSFEKRGMNVHLQRRISSYEEMDKLDAENDLLIYAGYLAPHAPMGASSFYGEECETFFYAFTKGKEKSIGVSLGSVYVHYDFYTNADTFVHTYSLSEEAMEAFVAAIFGEIEFKGVVPYKPAGPRM